MFADDVSSPSVGKTSLTKFPVDQWTCLEWSIDQVATVGQSSSHVFLNGVELTDLAVTNGTANPTDSNRLGVGIAYSSGRDVPNGLDGWFDQIVYSSARPGCFH